MENVQRAIDKLYREHFGKMVAILLCSFRDFDLETAEDIVQDSFTAALLNWSQQGIPINTKGWIYKVCRHKALNKIKRDERIEEFSEELNAATVETKFSESVLDDQQLKLLFACAHPDLSPKAQVVITLKYVVNLKAEAIAKVLAMSIDGVDKILIRSRQKIKDEKILLEEPVPSALKPRLTIVHKLIYLIFNEGYKSSSGKEILREELCEEALLLNKSLMDAGLADSETFALHALMLFNSARFKSRFGASGELLDLEQQDRSLWNKELISLGNYFHHQSQSETISTYHIEASIACLHCMAGNFVSTDWKTISGLYAHLLKFNSNPFVELNYAIALYYSGQKQTSFELLNQLQLHPFLSQYYLLNSALGKFYHLEADDVKAKQFLLKAYNQTNFEKEKDFIRKMISGLNDTDGK